MKRFSLTLTVLFLLAETGCRKSTPVEEVSLDQSGITVATRDVSSLEDSWPQWRGPQGNGRAVDQSLPVRWNETENIRWMVDVPGRGHSSPIVVGNLVVVGSALDQDQKQMVVAYDRASGDQQWTHVVHQGGFPSRRAVHQKATNANSTLTSDGNLLITAHLNSERIFVTALNLSGERVWQTDVGAFASKFGYAPSPVIYKSLVIVAADNFGGGYLAALDLDTGKVAWRRARGDASTYSSPHVATVGGIEQVLITGGDRLASYDPTTGEPLWQTECIAESTCGTVVTSEDRIFASGGYPNNETVCLSGTGERIWSDRTHVYEPSLVAAGGHVFAVTDDGVAYCWSAENGDVRWRKRLGGNFSSSPVICNGNVYVADLKGNCYVFQAAGDQYTELAKNRLGDDCYASPAVVGGAIYFRIGVGSGDGRSEKLMCVSAASPDGDGQSPN